MRVDWCVSSWFRIKNTHTLKDQGGLGGRIHPGVAGRLTRARKSWVRVVNIEQRRCAEPDGDRGGTRRE